MGNKTSKESIEDKIKEWTLIDSGSLTSSNDNIGGISVPIRKY